MGDPKNEYFYQRFHKIAPETKLFNKIGSIFKNKLIATYREILVKRITSQGDSVNSLIKSFFKNCVNLVKLG